MTEEKNKKKQLDISKLRTVKEIPEKKRKESINWQPILKGIIEKNNIIAINEDEASLGSVRNQVVKAVKADKTLECIVLNVRQIDKKQTLFISKKKK